MNDRLQRELAAWIEFYRELGFEDFYQRAQESLPPTGSAGAAVPQPGAEVVDGPSVQPPACSPSGLPRPQVTAAVSRPASFRSPGAGGLPSRALSLFEAPPPVRGVETLDQICKDLGDCHRCRLAAGRRTIVFGQGNPHAELVFVGEGPGADEDEQGLPFVGRAGKLLNRMIEFIGMKREDVYICNVVKCRPPGNRTPESDEVEACSPFLFRQIEAIKPRLLCCLGAPAVRTVLGIKEGITKIRGRIYDFGDAKALATVHPAYILRNPREEKILREDFEKIRDFLQQW